MGRKISVKFICYVSRDYVSYEDLVFFGIVVSLFVRFLYSFIVSIVGLFRVVGLV